MAREKFPSDDIDRLMVRFPPGMRDRLKAEAEANKRSMNAEIVARLEASLLLNQPTPDWLIEQYREIGEVKDNFAKLYEDQEKQIASYRNLYEQTAKNNAELISVLKELSAEMKLKR